MLTERVFVAKKVVLSGHMDGSVDRFILIEL